MERVGEHPVPAGPLAVRWLAYELEEQRAGVATRARVRLENAGTAPWRSRGREGVQLAYHWLDPLGNAIVWDGSRTALPGVVAPGETVELESPLVAPRPPGRYRLAFDLVEEFRFWFAEVGSAPLDLPVEVRAADRRAAARGATCTARRTRSSKPRWRRRRSRSSPRIAVAVAHLVAGAVPAAGLVAAAARRARRGLRGGRTGDRGRVAHRPATASRPGRRAEGATRASASRCSCRRCSRASSRRRVEGLPAYTGRDGLFEGRAVVRLRSRSGRPTG